MKKILPLILAAALALSLAACGDKTGENTNAIDNDSSINLESAQETTLDEIRETLVENEAKALDTYVGNIYTLSGFVRDITTEYCILQYEEVPQFEMQVYLPENELINIVKGELITVVGEISSFSEPDEFFVRSAEMKNAQYVGNTTEITGEIIDFDSWDGNDYCRVSTADITNVVMSDVAVYLPDDVMNELNEGDEITARGVVTELEAIVGNNGEIPPYLMKNAELVE